MSDLFDRFPDMTPIKSVPTLSTINGIGTTAYGARDHDPETGTYVKTVWFAFLFVPIVPLAAYRVASAPGRGWYFLGRVPVSGVAKGWTLTLLISIASIIAFFAYNSHVNSPSYKAGQQLAEAERLRNQGKLTASADLCRQVAEGPTDKSSEAVQAVTAMLDNPDLQAKGDGGEMAGVFRIAHLLRDKPGGIADKDLVARALRFAEARAQDSPDGSLAVLEAVEPATLDPTAALPLKQKILERLVQGQPDNVKLLSKLAFVYEQTGQIDRCPPLLEPHAKDLGVTEGARILGLFYYKQGKHDEAFALLEPYTEKGLKALHDAEQQLTTANDTFRQQVIDQLHDGTAPGFDFTRYQAANTTQQKDMLQAYYVKRLNENTSLLQKDEELTRRKVVVPAAIDLGMIRLGRAQRATKPAERQAELEQAEKTFKAVRDVAGDRADYQYGMGQVYYWLGKPAEGRKLFDEILKADGRKFDTLVMIAELLRQLGAMADARTLLEEAYNQPGANEDQRHLAAFSRALSRKDYEDELIWLERSDQTLPDVKALLAESRGHKAAREGKDEAAAGYYREAVAIYAKQPESAATLNNGGLANVDLYGVTGDRAALEQAAHMLEKALTLRPSDGILASNVANAQHGAALSELVGDRIDWQKLKRQAGEGDLNYLYQDGNERKALVQRASKSAAIAKARTQFDRALVLAPNNTGLYTSYAALLSFLGERDGLMNLERRAAVANIDQTEARKDRRDFLDGKKDEKYRRDAAAAAERAERTVAETRKAGGVTFAVAVGALMQTRLVQEVFAVDFDADELVRLAEEANRSAPSLGTRSTLELALLVRAHKTLSAQEPEYAALAAKGRRSLGSTMTIAVVLWREGKLRERALANADVKRSLELIRKAAAQFPEEPSEWSWVMLRPVYPDDAARIAAALKTYELLRLERAVDRRLSPPDVITALRQCWMLEAAGNLDEARAVLKRCAADGVTLPFDVP